MNWKHLVKWVTLKHGKGGRCFLIYFCNLCARLVHLTNRMKTAPQHDKDILQILTYLNVVSLLLLLLFRQQGGCKYFMHNNDWFTNTIQLVHSVCVTLLFRYSKFMPAPCSQTLQRSLLKYSSSKIGSLTWDLDLVICNFNLPKAAPKRWLGENKIDDRQWS